jgi:hypothetical protein
MTLSITTLSKAALDTVDTVMLNIVYAEFCVFIVMLTVLLLSVVVPVTVLARDNWNLTLADYHSFAYLFIPHKQNKGQPCKDLYTRN